MREFFQKPAGKGLAIFLILVGFGYAGWMLYTGVGPSDLAKIARDRVFIDADTGKAFEYQLKNGDKIPVSAPSGKQSGYPAELCYWTKDGKPKTDPTPVLVNQWLKKNEPTFCPDCGRLVVIHNPAPANGVKVPPTREEYEKNAVSPANE